MKHHRVDLNRNCWKTIPYAIPIGSKASKLVSATGKLSTCVLKYAEHLAMCRYAGCSISVFRGSWATRRGNDMEPLAAQWYEDQCGIKIKECGFFTDDLLRYGASPDRLVGDDGLVEIKCQDKKGHLKSLDMIKKNGRTPASYYPQIQMELLASERQWLDLVLYHPNYPSTIMRIMPDHEFHESLKSQIDICIDHRDSVFTKLLEEPWENSGLTDDQLELLRNAINKKQQHNGD